MSATRAQLFAALGPVLDGLPLSRRRVQAFYDGWLRAEAADGRHHPPANFIHAVWTASEALGPTAALALQDTTCATRLALAALDSEEAAYSCAIAAIAAGVLPPGQTQGPTQDPAQDPTQALPRALMAALRSGGARAVRQASSTREALTHPDDFWTDLGDILPAVQLARRRLCRIEVSVPNGKTRTGSGFLVGPSKVLTNLHVVDGIEEDLPDERKRHRRIVLHFDYSETTGRRSDAQASYHVTQMWCLSRGGMGDDRHLGPKDDYWWTDEDKRDDWLDLVADTLDYALIEVDGTPGLQRGWYRIDADPPGEPSGVWALHHPGQQGQTVTRGIVPPFQFGIEARLFHGASTIGGSSGGLILDQDGVPIALHYLGLQADTRDPAQSLHAINVAIPFPRIAAALRGAGLLDRLPEVKIIRPHRGSLSGGRPVFGRQRFLNDLQAFWKGDRRILRVSVPDAAVGARRPGKSFSAEIVAGLFRGPEHHHIPFSAAELKVDALRVTRDVLATFAEDLLPQIPQSPDTTSPAHVRRLVSFFAQAIRDRLPNRNVWVTIDDLDRFDLSDASGREFLATLYTEVRAMPSLRILLIGLPPEVEISGMAREDYAGSEIDGAEIDGLGSLFKDWLKESGARDDGHYSEESLDLMAAMLTSYAGQEAPLARLGEFVTEHLSATTRALFGGDDPTEGQP